ncbi:hypothetical protein D1BOALGB6SA_6905 [Olavius sp. associated proteobacterium Delta 1]|nr:hypothetical protein D1BOALGB6SA_6905 [Olavius sp. associated proteobacterium Delta 1]
MGKQIFKDFSNTCMFKMLGILSGWIFLYLFVKICENLLVL